MLIFNISMYLGDLIFFFNEIYFISLIIIFLCLGLFLNNIIKSLNLTKLIIELILPFIILNFFFIFYLLDLDILFFFNFKIDNFFIFFKFLFILLLFFCFYLSRYYFILEKIKIFEYTILLLLSVQGSFLVMLTTNLFIMYIALEIQNLCFYVLASLKRFNNFSVEAGLKYFLLGSFSSSLLLFGISLIYGLLGSLDIFDIYIILLNFNYNYIYIFLFIALFFFLCGFFFKLGGAPFHWWVPDVYEGSPTVVMMFFSILPKILLLFLLIKFYFYIFFFELNLYNFFLLIGLLSIIIGGINAMYQLKLKRFIAYSTIVNIGYILISLSIFSLEGMFSSIFYLICYLISVFSLFWFILYFRKNQNIEFIFLNELSLINYNIILLFFISILFFSFIGLPPFIGFFGKLFIYLNLLLQLNYYILILLLIFSVIIGFYYLRVIRFLYFYNFQFEKKNILNMNINNIFILFIYFNLIFLLFFDFFSEYILNLLIINFLNF